MEKETTSIYKILMMVYVPEATNGMGMLTIQLPNRSEYESVRKQIRRKKKMIVFTNEYEEPHTVFNQPPVLTLTVEKYEPKVFKDETGKEKPLIVLPNQVNPSNIHN